MILRQIKRTGIFCALSVLVSFVLSAQPNSTKIGALEWATSNLDVDAFRNGDKLMYCANKQDYDKAVYNNIPAYAYINFDPSNRGKFGAIYNMAAIMDPRGLAPNGWRIASLNDWKELRNSVKGIHELKSKMGWKKGMFDPESCVPNGTDKYGFNAIESEDYFSEKKGVVYSTFWFTSSRSSFYGLKTFILMCFKDEGAAFFSMGPVRCVKGDNLPKPVIIKKPADNIVEWVQVGYDVWMKNNLNVDTFRNGDKILEARTNEEWIAAEKSKTPAWCYYENDPANGKKYGRLYNYYATIDKRKLLPDGWIIPETENIFNLKSEVSRLLMVNPKGPMEGGLLRPPKEWNPTIYKADNSTGFTALPAGVRAETGGFESIKEYTAFWLRDSHDADFAYFFSIDDGNELFSEFRAKGTGHSIRGVWRQN
ncbi:MULTISPECIES: FISUMP domain-containing protein [unclassified Sediminibacterium]|uniref:FISUMP domain-containing protein n=1 Tax=unclassified Sediminibacterium TaxID=2635961 RepID=UPI00041F5D12|nr:MULTISPECIES: FISUMP domain-containing protein [unclassified Sediminibacterium]MDP3392722.1 FISUMP domain-containing protein [Sediminibacterium sp.]MDP3566035.1 FISUMP domain-containing protein [Sediminibacterium sp.]